MKKIHFISNSERRKNREISIFAIIETIFFICFTWFIAYTYDTYIHIYASLLISPLLLLKTKFSINKAIKWFSDPFSLHSKSYLINSFLYLLIYSALYSSILIGYLVIKSFFPTQSSFFYFFLTTLWGVHVVTLMLVIMLGERGVAFLEFFEKPIMFFMKNILILLYIFISILLILIFMQSIELFYLLLLAIFMSSLLSSELEYNLNITFFLFFMTLSVMGVFFYKLIIIVWNKINFMDISTILLTIGYIGFTIIIAIGLGFLIRSLLIKVFITLEGIIIFPIKTLNAIPLNFTEQILINDINYSPELLPSINQVNKDTIFSLSGLIEKLISKDLHRILRVFLLPLVPIFSLAFLYRWSIKSTAWFYFPLIYIANLKSLTNKESQKIAIVHQTYQLLLYFNITILALIFLHFGVSSTIMIEAFPSFKILFEIKNQIPFNISNNSIWLIIISCMLYFFVYYFASFQSHVKEKTGQEYYVKYNIFIYWIIRVKLMLWYIFFIWNLIYISNIYLIPKLSLFF